MLKKYFVLFFILAFIPAVFYAQNNSLKSLKKAAPHKYYERQTSLLKPSGNFNTKSVTAQNYVAVDTMSNSYGPAANTLNPLAYDPYSNTLTLAHRGNSTYGTGGRVYYNYSTDGGATWKRVPTPVNANTDASARFPSMAISNPTKDKSISKTTAVFSWPHLNAQGNFGNVGYGADQPIGAGQTFGETFSNPNLDYGTNVPTFTSDNSEWYFWTVENLSNSAITLFRTEAFNTIEHTIPAAWDTTAFSGSGGGSIALGGVSYKGTLYVAALATFPQLIGIGGWEPGYSKSTDNGATWSAWKVVDWTQIPATAQNTELWDWLKGDNFVSYTGDIQVDKDGFVHIVTGMSRNVDTLTGFGTNSLVEFIETSSGWDAKIIADNLVDSTKYQISSGTGANQNFFDPGIGQSGPSIMIATDSARDVFVTQWTYGSPTTKDSLADIYMSSRTLAGNWSAPMNLTQTDNKNEDGAHLAPMLAGSGSSFTAFSGYWYAAGSEVYNPLATNPAVFYVAPVTLSITGVDDKPVSNVYDFSLSSNYPNPFNPSTTIKYTIPKSSYVTLKVFDILGREVSNLVSETKSAGAYNVTFNASNLASGLYIYTLKADNLVTSKKMMLLK